MNDKQKAAVGQQLAAATKPVVEVVVSGQTAEHQRVVLLVRRVLVRFFSPATPTNCGRFRPAAAYR